MAQPPPPRALRPYVTACFGYHEENVREYVHVGLPSSTLTIVIDLTTGLRVSGLGHARPQRFEISVAGLHTSPAAIHEGGTSHGVMLYLTPLGARALLGMPAAALAHQVIELDSLLGPVAQRLRNQMLDAGDWACLSVLHGWLLRCLRHPRHDSVGLQAWDCIMAGALHRVTSLAQATGWSQRHLHQAMHTEVGMSPRTVLSLNRFDRTVPDVRAGKPLAEVAAAHGYADQAHLTREWRRFAGLAPSVWRQHEGIGTRS